MGRNNSPFSLACSLNAANKNNTLALHSLPLFCANSLPQKGQKGEQLENGTIPQYKGMRGRSLNYNNNIAFFRSNNWPIQLECRLTEVQFILAEKSFMGREKCKQQNLSSRFKYEKILLYRHSDRVHILLTAYHK